MKNSKQSDQKSLLDCWEVKNVKDTAFGDGFEKGELAKALKVAKILKSKGISLVLRMGTLRE